MTLLNDARAVTRFLKPLIQFAQSIEDAGDMDAIIKGHQEALDALKAQQAEVQKESDNIKADLQVAKDAIRAAKSEAEKIISDANAQAEKIRADVLAEASAKKLEAQTEIDNLKGTISYHREQVGKISDAVSAKQAELDNIHGEIAKLKARFNG